MEMFRPLLQYFKGGFTLANSSLDIYFISLSSWIFTYLGSIELVSPSREIVSVITFVAVFLYFAFDLSIPRFLIDVRKDREFSYARLFKITLVNAKRIILPTALIVASIAVLSVLAFLVYTRNFLADARPSDFAQITASLDQFGKQLEGWNSTGIIFSLCMAVISSLLVFTSIYFSLERKGLIRAIWMSVATSLKHKYFVLIVGVINIAVFLLLKFLPTGQGVGGFIAFALLNYFNLFLVSSCLLYYKKEVKKG